MLRARHVAFAALLANTACASTTRSGAGRADASGDVSAPDDVAIVVDARTPPDATTAGGPPRLLRPLSATYTTRAAPTLRWEMPPGATRAQVRVCLDAECRSVVHDLTVVGDRVTVPARLATRAHFWRVAVGGSESATWSFWPSPRSASIDTSFGQVADFNRDGFADLAFIVDGSVQVSFGRGGPFGPAADQTIRAATGRYCGIVMGGDLDGDGFIDLVAHRCTAEGEGRAWEQLRGGATALGIGVALPVSDNARVAGVGDVDGDGRSDLVASGSDSTTFVCVLLGGGRVVDLVRPVGAPARATAWPAAVWDVDGDGVDEIGVGVYGTATEAWVLRGAASASPRWTPLRSVTEPAGRNVIVHALHGGDLDGDGASDVLVARVLYDNAARRNELSLEVHRGGAGGPSEAPSQTLMGALPGDLPPRRVLVTDVDNNGFSEVLVGAADRSDGGPRVSVLRFQGTSVGVSSMGTRWLTRLGASDAPALFPVGVGDINGDGLRDVAVFDEGARSLSVYAGNTATALALRTWGDIATPASWFASTVVGSN